MKTETKEKIASIGMGLWISVLPGIWLFTGRLSCSNRHSGEIPKYSEALSLPSGILLFLGTISLALVPAVHTFSETNKRNKSLALALFGGALVMIALTTNRYWNP